MNADDLSKLKRIVQMEECQHSPLIRTMLKHIDEQAKQLVVVNHRCADLQQVCDGQDEQIAILKAAIRKERLMTIDRNIGNLAFRKSMVNDQLARELPEIDWSDMK
jgi:ABC-type lipoprotein export system ATPase subunit